MHVLVSCLLNCVLLVNAIVCALFTVRCLVITAYLLPRFRQWPIATEKQSIEDSAHGQNYNQQQA